MIEGMPMPPLKCLEPTRLLASTGRFTEMTLLPFDDATREGLAPDWAGSWSYRWVRRRQAETWIPRYHYSGTIGHTGAWFLEICAPDVVAMVGVGPATNAFGLERAVGLQEWRGNREITRVAVHPDAPRNSASRAVTLACAAMRERSYEWLFSYADAHQGHHGGIYQAVNAVYVGTNLGGKPPPRWEIYKDGAWAPVQSRSLQRLCGTGREGAVARMAERGVQVRIVGPGSLKHTYVLPCGGPAVNRRIRSVLRPRAKPYPKRSSA